MYEHKIVSMHHPSIYIKKFKSQATDDDGDGVDNNDKPQEEGLQGEMGWLVPNKGGWYKCWVIKARSKNEQAAKFLQSQMLLLLIFSGYLGARTEWWSALALVVVDDDDA